MGEAKRRKALDPNYGKLTAERMMQGGFNIFPELFLKDYYQFRFSQLSIIISDPKYTSDRVYESVKSLWDMEKIESYIETLENTTLQKEFVTFLFYICQTKMGSILLKGIEMSQKRKAKEDDLFALWTPLLMASIKLHQPS